MQDIADKKVIPTESSSISAKAEIGDVDAALPPGWRYKSIKIGPMHLPWHASPMAQLLIVSFVCFLCPGMFNALSGLGGGGQVDASASDKANVALYSTFAVVGFFAGSIVNTVGVKISLSLGGLGYCVYVASFLCYDYTQSDAFVIFAGALLGACAGLLWAAQGVIMMSYPGEGDKGKSISIFWIIFNTGAVIGSLIPLGQNINEKSKSSVSHGTYVAFLVLTFLGACLAWCLADAKNIIRADCSKVIVMKHPTWKTELLGLLEVLRTDLKIILLFPMFFASNWFYTYQFNEVNSAYFNTRTRALNNVLYWSAQIIGAIIFGNCLDLKYRRSLRAKVAWVVLFSLTFAIWGGGYAFQTTYTRESTSPDAPINYTGMDWTDSGYIGPMFLYFFFGFYDAAWQTCVYWFMGSLTNNGRKLANHAGFYKGIQSTGAAIVWRLDGLGTPYMNIFASCWALLAGALLMAAPLIWFKIKDHVDVEEDLEFSDETLRDVKATGTEEGQDYELA